MLQLCTYRHLTIVLSVLFIGCVTDDDTGSSHFQSVLDSESSQGVQYVVDTDLDGVTFRIRKTLAEKIGTVGVIEWSTNIDASIDNARIEFGTDDSYGAIAPVDLSSPGFRTLLLGLKGEREYHFRIVVESNGKEFTSRDETLVTGPVLNIPRPEVKMLQPEKSAGGYMVLSSYTGMSFTQNPMALIIDADGELVWWYNASSLMDSTKACMSYNGDYMAIVSSNNRGLNGSVEIVSLDHEDVRRFTQLKGASHDITPIPGNGFAYLEFIPDGDLLITHTCAKVMELNMDGSVREILDTALVWGSECHGNALRYSETEGLFTVSDYEHSEIAAFDRDGNVAWVTKNDGIWEYQHGHQLLSDSLLLFNNGSAFSETNRQSYVLEFEFTDDNGGLNEIWRYSVDGLGTPTLGDVQRLPNGNTLVSYSNKAIIHEVDPNGSLVRTLDLGQTAFGYVVWRSTLYGSPDDLKL